jgi:hypothetical protein
MPSINTYSNCCLYREFLNTDSLFIMIYCKSDGKFYQKYLETKEWSTICTNFTLQELELIFQACINQKPGYLLEIIKNKNDLSLKFTCKELIKTYSWKIILMEKTVSDTQKIEHIFNQLRKYLVYQPEEIHASNLPEQSNDPISIKIHKLFSEVYDGKEIINFLDNMESNIKNLFISQKKELLLIPHIAMIHNPPPKNNSIPCNQVEDDGVSIEDDGSVLSENVISLKPKNILISKKSKSPIPNKKKSVNSKKVNWNNDDDDSDDEDEVDIDDDDTNFDDDDTNSDDGDRDSDDNDNSQSDNNSAMIENIDEKKYEKFIKKRSRQLHKLNPRLCETECAKIAFHEWKRMHRKK